MGPFELTKLVSLYKAYCTGHLTPEIVKNEILDTREEVDNRYYKTGEKSCELNDYIQELEYLLFEVMHYEKQH